MVVLPFGHYISNEDGMHVTVSSWRRIDDNVIPARGKIAGAYVNSAFAKTDALRAGFDEVIVLNNDGHISEGSAANFFLLRNGAFATPPITDNVLEGITRRTIIQLIRDELKMEVQERTIDRTELYFATKLSCAAPACRSARSGAWIIVRSVQAGSAKHTARLRKIFYDVVKGKSPKYRDWCTPVYESKPASSTKDRTPVTVK